MSVVTRKFAASPNRSSAETWSTIVNAIAGNNGQFKTELNSVVGIAASIIADQTPSSFPITVIGSGPRLRIYCLYDDDAIGEDAHEDPLSWDLFCSDWRIHFPVEKSDLEWVSEILQEKGSHFLVYETGEKIKEGENQSDNPTSQLTINAERLKAND